MQTHNRPGDSIREVRNRKKALQAGLLTYGSTYWPGLPILSDSGVIWRSSPITAAGPRRNFTVFPGMAQRGHLKAFLLFTCQNRMAL